MSYTIFRSTDAGAPVLTGQLGKWPAVMKACLVDGYGTGLGFKPPAGWVVAYEDTNRIVLRPGPAAGSRQYYRIAQNAEDGDASICRLLGYVAMSSVDAGTGVFPGSGNLYQRVSAANNGTAREWFVAADDRTAIFGVKNGNATNGSRWCLNYIGNLYSHVAHDEFAGIITGNSVDGEGKFDILTLRKYDNVWQAYVPGIAGARTYDQSPGATQPRIFSAGVMLQPPSSQYGTGIGGRSASTNLADGKSWLAPIWVMETAPASNIRGTLKGLAHPLVPIDQYSDGETMTDETGKTWMYLRTRTQDYSDSNTELASAIWLQTSTPDSN